MGAVGAVAGRDGGRGIVAGPTSRTLFTAACLACSSITRRTAWLFSSYTRVSVFVARSMGYLPEHAEPLTWWRQHPEHSRTPLEVQVFSRIALPPAFDEQVAEA
jgi:hypothetical protein